MDYLGTQVKSSIAERFLIPKPTTTENKKIKCYYLFPLEVQKFIIYCVNGFNLSHVS